MHFRSGEIHFSWGENPTMTHKNAFECGSSHYERALGMLCGLHFTWGKNATIAEEMHFVEGVAMNENAVLYLGKAKTR